MIEVYNPKDKTTLRELRISDPRAVGRYCSFESFMGKKGGVGSLRFKLGRKSNEDLVVVAPLKMRYIDNKHTPGCVTFEVEFDTSKINGKTGSFTPPHEVTGLLKRADYCNSVVAYAREQVTCSPQTSTRPCPRARPTSHIQWRARRSRASTSWSPRAGVTCRPTCMRCPTP